MGKWQLNKLFYTLIVFIIGFYLLLNYGFMQIKLPPGLPIGEFILLVLLVVINHQRTLPAFIKSRVFIPFAAWLIIGLIHTFIGTMQNGMLAIRDASHVIDSLYLYVGYAFGSNIEWVKMLGRRLPTILFWVFLYSLSYPFRFTLFDLSPKTVGFQDQPVNLLFYYINTPLVLMLGSAYFFSRFFNRTESAKDRQRAFWLGVINNAYILILFPSRTLYIQVIALYGYFASKMTALKLSTLLMMILAPMAIIVLVFSSGLQIHGRFGTEFRLSDFLQLFLEIFGGTDSDNVISSGNAGRFVWWYEVFEKWTHSWVTVLFGVGYGVPLIEFGGIQNVVIREPHNDWISVLARGGLFVFLFYAWMQWVILTRSLNINNFLRNNKTFSSISTILLFIVIFTLIATIGEAPFVMSFYAIPFYFSAGVLLRLDKLKKTLV